MKKLLNLFNKLHNHFNKYQLESEEFVAKLRKADIINGRWY